MFNAGALTFQEFAVRDPLPLTTIHQAVLEVLPDRDDGVLFGATAADAECRADLAASRCACSRRVCLKASPNISRKLVFNFF